MEESSSLSSRGTGRGPEVRVQMRWGFCLVLSERSGCGMEKRLRGGRQEQKLGAWVLPQSPLDSPVCFPRALLLCLLTSVPVPSPLFRRAQESLWAWLSACSCFSGTASLSSQLASYSHPSFALGHSSLVPSCSCCLCIFLPLLFTWPSLECSLILRPAVVPSPLYPWPGACP